jgi:hypothetical protein
MLWTLTGCGPEMIDGLDTSEAGLVAFVREGRYKGWRAEPGVHASTGPHGKVRVFFNDKAVQSLQAGNATHPRGTALVKELYAPDGTTLTGHAVDVKVADGAGKDTWLFFESVGLDYTGNFYGRGHPACHGCHAAGKDYVTTALPPN